jgi:hypothetical protein
MLETQELSFAEMEKLLTYLMIISLRILMKLRESERLVVPFHAVE